MAAPQIANSFQVAEAELAYLVLNYLEEKGWKKTAGSLKREAKDLLRAGSQRFAVGTIPKPLATIVSEYLQLTYKETQRAMLQKMNPLAQSMYSLLDFTAGGAAMQTTTAGTAAGGNTNTAPNNNGHMNYPQQQQQQVHMMYPPQIPQQHQLPPPSHHNDNKIGGAAGGILMIPFGGPANNQHQQQHHQQTPGGGRHAQRKGAPKKRRRLENDFESTRLYHPPANGAGGGTIGGAVPYGTFPPLDNTNNTHNIDPLNNAEYSLFGDVSFDFLHGAAVVPAEVIQWSTLLADNINKTGMHEDYSLTDMLLEDKESAEFLAKYVGTHPAVDPDFRFTTFGGPSPAPAPPPSATNQAAQKRPSLETSAGQQPARQTPMSPLGGSRLGKRKNTPTKIGAHGTGSGGKPQRDRSAAAPSSAQKDSERDRRALAEELAELSKNPKVFEDLINECVG